MFFGGARGGGKTDGVLGKWANRALADPSFNAVGLRRKAVAFDDAIERAREIFTPLGAKFVSRPPKFTFPNGARVSFAYLDRSKDAENYQGKNVKSFWIEEAGQYPDPRVIDKLFGAMRGGDDVQMILTGNPGGAGQQWLAERFRLVPFPDRPVVRTVRIGTGKVEAAVIPSRIQDNRILLDADPSYVDRLKLVGSQALVRAWLEGDWSAIEGAYFDCWSSRIIVRPFKIPADWPRIVSFDWGSAAPFSAGWWAVARDDHGYIPRNSLVRYREWYGAKSANVGLKLKNSEVGAGIRERTGDERITDWVADPSIFKEEGGPSIAEQMGLPFRRADNNRIAGWGQMRRRMLDRRVFCFRTCTNSIRTIPLLQHSDRRPEDLDTSAEDHAADEWRYAHMARPYAPPPTRRRPRDAWMTDEEDTVSAWI